MQNIVSQQSIIGEHKWEELQIQREKGRDLAQSYDKSPFTDRKIQKQRERSTLWKVPGTYAR